MNLPADYWSGNTTLELEYPWLTPESINFIEDKVKGDVLEFGSGGSTLFFSRRAKTVLSFETNPDWFRDVKKTLEERKLLNVSLNLITCAEDCKSPILNTGLKFDVVLVDCDPRVMERFQPLKFSSKFVKTGGILILDNYAAEWCGNHELELSGWSFKDFDDQHWYGRGTRVYLT
jgi:hypothetical protein